MSDKENNPVICLHTDRSGLIWFIDSANNLQKMDLLSCLSHIFSSELFSFKPSNYKIFYTDSNLELIVELDRLLSESQLNSNMQIGSPGLFKKYKYNSPLHYLQVLSLASPFEYEMGAWQRICLKFSSTLSLVSAYAEDKHKALELYNQFFLKKYFDFVGLDNGFDAISLISYIVDPRWYANVRRPGRLASFERLMGLGSETKPFKKSKLYKSFKSLDCASFVLKPSLAEKDQVKLLLHFLVRAWLGELGYFTFKPDLFFDNKSIAKEAEKLIGDA